MLGDAIASKKVSNLQHFSKYVSQAEKILEKEKEIAKLEEMRHRRIASHLGTNFVVECYMGSSECYMFLHILHVMSVTFTQMNQDSPQKAF